MRYNYIANWTRYINLENKKSIGLQCCCSIGKNWKQQKCFVILCFAGRHKTHIILAL